MAGRIIVGVDGSEQARNALQWALSEAKLRSATVEAVSAWGPPYEAYELAAGGVGAGGLLDVNEIEKHQQEWLDGEIERIQHEYPEVEIERVTVNDAPSSALLDRAKGADLLVVGSRGRGGFVGLLLGSVSQQLVHHANCPVVVVPTHHASGQS